MYDSLSSLSSNSISCWWENGEHGSSRWRVTFAVGEMGSVDGYGSNLLYLDDHFTSTITNSLSYFHIVSNLS
jgi:hypothetical protein